MDLEAIPVGTYSVEIRGSGIWSDRSRQQTLLRIIRDIRSSYEDALPGIRFIRHYVVAVDVRATIHYWQRELGLPEITTSKQKGEVAGKALVWGSGNEETTFAVVILSEQIANALQNSDHLQADIAGRVVAHELAHVHDYWRQLREIGPKPWPMNNDWHGIRRFIAVEAWGEYFAEYFAASHEVMPDCSEETWFSHELLGGGLHDVADAIARFRFSRDSTGFWNFAVERLSNVFCALGRGLGIADAYGRGDVSALLIEAGLRAEIWAGVVDSAREEFRCIAGLTTWRDCTFSPLCKTVEEGFHAAGVVPKQNGHELRFDCPFF